jgi:hypothetical protein
MFRCVLKWVGIEKMQRPWQDSNLQSSAPEADALSIRPQGHRYSFYFISILLIKKRVARKDKGGSFNNHFYKNLFTLLQLIFFFANTLYRVNF